MISEPQLKEETLSLQRSSGGENYNTQHKKKNPGWGLQQRDWRLLAQTSPPPPTSTAVNPPRSSSSLVCVSLTRGRRWQPAASLSRLSQSNSLNVFFPLRPPHRRRPPPRAKELEAVLIWNASQVLHCLACALCEKLKRQNKPCWSRCFRAGVSFFFFYYL